MRVGLALILVGHVNLLVGAVLHGTVLRHVANPRGAVTPEYTTANVISVGSGLLSVTVGLVALLASRNLLLPRLVRGVEEVSQQTPNGQEPQIEKLKYHGET